MALVTFGVQKLRGKSTKRSFRDAALVGGIGQLGGMAGVPGITPFGSAGTAGTIQGLGQTSVGQGISSLFPQAAGTGTIAANSPFATAGASSLSGTGAAAQGATQGATQGGGFLSNLMPKTDMGRFIAASTILPLLTGGIGGDGPSETYLPIPNQFYSKYANAGLAGTPTGFQTRDYSTGINSPLVQPGEFVAPEDILGDQPTQEFKAVEYNKGGLASIAKFNEGGLGQVLPTKMTHDENDSNNYDRANGFVLDGTGHGKDHEDTMLAQLADGEFVSRSHAVLGAGIIAGANPSDKSDQRKKGAKFFYDQQKQFKRIFDLINANKTRH